MTDVFVVTNFTILHSSYLGGGLFQFVFIIQLFHSYSINNSVNLSYSLCRAWIARRAKLDQCLEMQLFQRDCEQAETWMAAREATLEDNADDGGASVESLIKKHENFDRAISAQEEKIVALQNFAEQLVDKDHYDKDGVLERREQVLDR